MKGFEDYVDKERRTITYELDTEKRNVNITMEQGQDIIPALHLFEAYPKFRGLNPVVTQGVPEPTETELYSTGRRFSTISPRYPNFNQILLSNDMQHSASELLKRWQAFLNGLDMVTESNQNNGKRKIMIREYDPKFEGPLKKAIAGTQYGNRGTFVLDEKDGIYFIHSERPSPGLTKRIGFPSAAQSNWRLPRADLEQRILIE